MNFASELDDAVVAELVEPLGVVADLGLVGVEDLEDLLLVGLGVGGDLLARERLAGDVLAGGVADHRGEVADEEDDRVAELLEVPQLAHQHGVAEVQVGRGGVEAGLDAQRLAGGEGVLQTRAQASLASESAAGMSLGDALVDEVELVGYGEECGL